MAQGLHSCGLYTLTFVVKGSILSHTVVLVNLPSYKYAFEWRKLFQFVNLSLWGFENHSWTKCSLCFFVVLLQTLFRLSFCLGVCAFSTYLVAFSLFGLSARVAKHTFIACLVRILVSFIGQHMYFFFSAQPRLALSLTRPPAIASFMPAIFVPLTWKTPTGGATGTEVAATQRTCVTVASIDRPTGPGTGSSPLTGGTTVARPVSSSDFFWL